jgi:hypothetical protein
MSGRPGRKCCADLIVTERFKSAMDYGQFLTKECLAQSRVALHGKIRA